MILSPKIQKDLTYRYFNSNITVNKNINLRYDDSLLNIINDSRYTLDYYARLTLNNSNLMCECIEGYHDYNEDISYATC